MITSFLPHNEQKVSRFGFGAMRLPLLDHNDQSSINESEALTMIRHAIDNGVTYVDTAYGYHGGKSETFIGKALKDGYREKVSLATKLPVWLVETREDMDRLFHEQLERLGVEYVDFYLLHALNQNHFEKMKTLGYQDFLNQLKSEGKIRFAGFSFHDELDVFKSIIDDYDWDMTQIQLNLLDENYQAGLEGLYYAAKKEIKIVIMEPLRGGALSSPPKEVQQAYQQFPVSRSSVEWSFRYLYNMPEIMTILSGMSTMEQVKDNLRIFAQAKANTLTQEEKELLEQVKELFLARIKTHCTGCSYCQPCPQDVKIPDIFRGYDNHYMLDALEGWKKQYASFIENNHDASKCIACGLCEEACPQHLPIISLLEEIHQQA